MSQCNLVCHAQITLIDQNEQFVFKPLLYELINGGAKPEEVAPLFSDLLAPMTSTSFVQVSLLSPLGLLCWADPPHMLLSLQVTGALSDASADHIAAWLQHFRGSRQSCNAQGSVDSVHTGHPQNGTNGNNAGSGAHPTILLG